MTLPSSPVVALRQERLGTRQTVKETPLNYWLTQGNLLTT